AERAPRGDSVAPSRRSASAQPSPSVQPPTGSVATSAASLVLLQASVVAAALCILLLLALEGPVTSWLRLGLATVSGALQATYSWFSWRNSRRDDRSLLPFVPVMLGVVTEAAAALALLSGNPDESLISLAGTEHLLWGLSMLWVAGFEASLETARRDLLPALTREVLRISGEQTTPVNPDSLRP